MGRVTTCLSHHSAEERRQTFETLSGVIKLHITTLVEQCRRHVDTQTFEMQQKMENRSQETFSAFARNLASQCNTNFGKFAARVARLENAGNATVADLNPFKTSRLQLKHMPTERSSNSKKNLHGTAKNVSEIVDKISKIQLCGSESDEMHVDQDVGSHDPPSPHGLPSIIRKCPRPLFLLACPGVSDKAGPRHGGLPIATGRG